MTSILLDDSLDKEAPSSLFQNPENIIIAHRLQDVPQALKQLEQAIADGFYAAGFFTYEMGYALEERLTPLLPKNLKHPLLWFGLFRDKKSLDENQALEWISRQYTAKDSRLSRPSFSLNKADYEKKFQKVMDYIRAGDIYQLNLTFRQRFTIEGCPYRFYQAIRKNQPVRYGAVIDCPDFKIMSFSPEQFITIKNGIMTTRPMKGTIRRGQDQAEDRALCKQLFGDSKNRAENLMIVDLMRNDLSRIAEPGSVRTSGLFRIEKFNTLFQMTSSLSARTQPGTSLVTVLKSLFPAGSIIGAPKVRAQEIIAQLENEPRGVYTGAIGSFAPGGEASFNVAIRTVFMDNSQKAEIGIGGGIVSDSEVTSEYEECLLKRSFLTPDKKESL